MSSVYRTKCDGCHREAGFDHPGLGFWFSLTRNNPREFDDAGDSDRLDFCSLPCLADWAHRRQIEASPVRRTVPHPRSCPLTNNPRKAIAQ